MELHSVMKCQQYQTSGYRIPAGTKTFVNYLDLQNINKTFLLVSEASGLQLGKSAHFLSQTPRITSFLLPFPAAKSLRGGLYRSPPLRHQNTKTRKENGSD